MPHVLAQDLRNAVLQAALEGKLTSRSESDSDINETLAVITADIGKKLKAKEIKKLPAFSPVTNEEWDTVPDGWQAVKLGQISYFISKGTTPRGGNVAYCTDSFVFATYQCSRILYWTRRNCAWNYWDFWT